MLVHYVIFPILLFFSLELFGFKGCAIALNITFWLSFIFILIYYKLKKYDERFYEGILFKESILNKSILNFAKLSFYGIMSSTEWWFWEICSLMVA